MNVLVIAGYTQEGAGGIKGVVEDGEGGGDKGREK